MTTSTKPEITKYMKEFRGHLRQVDEVAQVVLKGHLIIESVLENIITLGLYYPQYLQDARLSFYQKVHIAKALCLRKNTVATWKLILAVNELRNAIAHSLSGEKRTTKMEQLRRLCSVDGILDFDSTPDRQVAEFACGVSTAFLAGGEADMKNLRAFVDAYDPPQKPSESEPLLELFKQTHTAPTGTP